MIQGRKSKSNTNNQGVANCFHCGDVCDSETVHFEEKSFCCHGCRSVFELLKDCNLDAYYEYEDTPGIKKLKALDKAAYAYLDSEEIVQKLVSFQSESLLKVTFRLPAMHCASCIWLIEHFKKLVPGVIESRVNFIKREALFSFDPTLLTLRKLVEQLDTIGYEPDLNLEQATDSKAKKAPRKIIYQIGIAGFCFGNIMLLSFPDYLTGAGSVNATYRSFFGYINFLLAIPVLLYSARDYLRSAWVAVKHKQINMDVPIALGILALFSRSSYEIFAEGGGGYMDSLAALIFFLLIGKWVQQKSYDSLSFERDYKSYFPISVQVIENGKEIARGIESVEKGAEYKVRSGELIPFDSVLLSDKAAIDYSFVSGESDPVTVQKGDKIFAGGRQIGVSISLEVAKRVNQSYLTALWNDDTSKVEGQDISTFADQVGRRFTVAVVLIAIVTGVYWAVVEPSIALNAVSAVLIVACPCALALSFPFAFGNAVRLMGRKGFYLKNGQALAQMAKVSHIVFDKTGTLTRKGDALVKYEGRDLIPQEMSVLSKMTGHSSHPLSRYIHAYISNEIDVDIERFEEITGSGLRAESAQKKFRIGSASFVKTRSIATSTMLSEVFVSIDGEIAGKFAVDKHYHPNLKGIIASLKQRYKLYLVSGDNDGEKDKMEKLFGQKEGIFFNQLPHQKEAIVKNLESEGYGTAMIGDGLNDANALRAASFGISVADDVFRFSPASDAILTADYFLSLGDFFRYSRQTLRLVKWSFVISFCYNGLGLFFAVQGLLTPVIAAILMPVSSLSVVGFVTLGSRYLYSSTLKSQKVSKN